MANGAVLAIVSVHWLCVCVGGGAQVDDRYSCLFRGPTASWHPPTSHTELFVHLGACVIVHLGDGCLRLSQGALPGEEIAAEARG